MNFVLAEVIRIGGVFLNLITMYNERSKVILTTLELEGWVKSHQERLAELENQMTSLSNVKSTKITPDGVECVWNMYDPYQKSSKEVTLLFKVIDRDFDFRIVVCVCEPHESRKGKKYRRGQIVYQDVINWSCIYSYYIHGECYKFGNESQFVNAVLAHIRGRL